jgi:signal transduction histidine kinase/ligand-binding sensor domain-containing protein
MRKIIFIVLIFCFTGSSAQYIKPFFNKFSIENGLPEGYVTSSLQDKLGFMWFGTQNGLVRYDGYQLKTYAIPDDKGNPLIYCSIQQLYEDRKGKLWAFVDKEGLFYLDRQKDAFIKVKMVADDSNLLKDYYFDKWMVDRKSDTHWFTAFDAKNNYKPCVLSFDPLQNKFERYESTGKGNQFIPAYETADLIQDRSGKIWLAADSLVSYFDSGSKSFKTWFLVPDSTKRIRISSLTADPGNKESIWINTYISGLDEAKNPYKRKFYQFNTLSKEYKVLMPDASDPLSIAGNCINIIADSLNRTWFTTKKGISRYNPEQGSFTNYNLTLPDSLSGDKINIAQIAADKDGNLWLGGYFKGLFYFDVKKAVATFYSHSDDPGSLPDFGNGIVKLFFDRSGTLWISMPWNGLAYLDPQKSMFNPLAIGLPFKQADESKSLNKFIVVGRKSDSIFYVKNTTGLFAWNYKQNSYERIELNNDKVYRQIECVLAANDGLVWIGSRAEGLFSYNQMAKSVKNFRNDPKDSTSISSNYINILTEDKNGNLWIGTGDKGICHYNRPDKIFTSYPFIQNNGAMEASNELDDGTVLSMYFDSEEILWIGTNLGGLNRFDPQTEKFTSFLDLKSGFNCIINIYEDSKDRLWAGTYLSGLFLFDKKTGDKKRYSEKDGLLFNSVIGISEDNAGNIWLASARGLSRLNPESNIFKNYPVPIGDSRSNTSILFRSTDGLFQVAKTGGLISFNPEGMNESTVPPAVAIESVGFTDENNNDTVLFTYGRNELKLKYNENRISFEFVALHYANSELNQYAYRLDGFDKEWIQAGTQRMATYTNLSNGTYNFHVKAANSDGFWNETGASFTVIILPPWWKTWWAYGVYLLLLLAVILAVHRFQKERTIRMEKEKTQKRELEQAKEIEKAYHQLKITQTQLVQSEKMASLGELTAGIAHEIQNPLNFVNNFSEVSAELVDEMKQELTVGSWQSAINGQRSAVGGQQSAIEILDDIKQNLEKILHHGKRADAIVKGMLQHSRTSTGQKEPTDINALADEYLRLAYHGLRAKDKSFNATMKTDFDVTIGNINIIPQDIGRVILNLITNAFYAADEKKKQLATDLSAFSNLTGLNDYEPSVTVCTKKKGNSVIISVTDNGNGIPQKILDKIFQPFFTTKPTGQGTGLGLSLSYDIVKAHGGELKVETKEGEGTEFIIILPV